VSEANIWSQNTFTSLLLQSLWLVVVETNPLVKNEYPKHRRRSHRLTKLSSRTTIREGGASTL
jgi:hypothetical protein